MLENMRTIAIVWVLLSAPLAMGSIGWGLSLIFQTAGFLPFFLCCASVFTAALGVASLIDNPPPQPRRPQADR